MNNNANKKNTTTTTNMNTVLLQLRMERPVEIICYFGDRQKASSVHNEKHNVHQHGERFSSLGYPHPDTKVT